jgi:broad specificity phosphatase PhoE
VEIVLIRHGQPSWREGEDYTLNPHLTKLGLEQANLSASALHEKYFRELWVSDLKRAKETLVPFEENLDFASLCVYPWLREMSDEKEKSLFGKTKKEISDFFINRNTRPFDEWINNDHGQYFADYSSNILENLEEELLRLGVSVFKSKTEKVFSIENPKENNLLIVSHAGTMSVILSFFLDVPLYPWTWRRFLPVHGAHTYLRSAQVENGYLFRLKKFNDASFYDGEHFITY